MKKQIEKITAEELEKIMGRIPLSEEQLEKINGGNTTDDVSCSGYCYTASIEGYYSSYGECLAIEGC